MRRGSHSAAAVTAASLLLAGCGAARSLTPSGTSSFAAVERAMVGCLLRHHLIPAQELRGQSWLSNGAVRDDAALAAWMFQHAGTVYGGKTLDSWATAAVRHWPASYCGPAPRS